MKGEPDALVAPKSRFKVRVDNLSAATELLIQEPGATVSLDPRFDSLHDDPRFEDLVNRFKVA